MENWFQCSSIAGYHIATKFCACHDSTALMPCIKCHSKISFHCNLGQSRIKPSSNLTYAGKFVREMGSRMLAYVKNNDPVRWQFCACHDWWAGVTYSNFRPDRIIRIPLTSTRIFIEFQSYIRKPLLKRIRGIKILLIYLLIQIVYWQWPTFEPSHLRNPVSNILNIGWEIDRATLD